MTFKIKQHKLNLLISRFEQITPHVAYFLLKNRLFIPKMSYFLRTCALWKFSTLLEDMDSLLKESLESIFNICLNSKQQTMAASNSPFVEFLTFVFRLSLVLPMVFKILCLLYSPLWILRFKYSIMRKL
jgi:hypothetical protein